MPLDRILDIYRPVCSALNFAHDENLVHCDIKASNIMIEDCGKVQQRDIYSLGMFLFEMLTGGERPFTGETIQTG